MAISRASSRIVLAEDNPADVGLVREALKQHEVDCELRVISDGEEALAFIERLEHDTKIPCPDLFLLDLHLPKHDGHEVLKHFRASGRCAETPVVILTSSDPAWIKSSIPLKVGFVDFFQKPASLAQFMHLGSLVKELIGRSQA